MFLKKLHVSLYFYLALQIDLPVRHRLHRGLICLPMCIMISVHFHLLPIFTKALVIKHILHNAAITFFEKKLNPNWTFFSWSITLPRITAKAISVNINVIIELAIRPRWGSHLSFSVKPMGKAKWNADTANAMKKIANHTVE